MGLITKKAKVRQGSENSEQQPRLVAQDDAAAALGEPQDSGLTIQLPLRAILREQLHEFVVGTGIRVLSALLERERTELCGPRYSHQVDRRAGRAGSVQGELVLGGRRVSVQRPRVRSPDGELPLPSWKAFANDDPLKDRAVEQMVIGVSTRKYERSLDSVPPGVKTRGASKSAVSRRFVEETQQQLETTLDAQIPCDLVVLMIDGIHFAQHVILVALGVDRSGQKHVLGFVEGATENAVVCTSLLNNLRDRGLPTDRSMLFVIDGGKGLHKAIKDVFGDRALIQRCQVHKKRNVLEHLPKAMQDSVGLAISEAYKAGDADRASKLLKNLARQLQNDHPGAAGSIEEGLDETLTVMRLEIPRSLERMLSTTNAIENLMGTARRVSKRVDRWRDGSMILRWVGASMAEAARGFRKVRGYKGMEKLVRAMTEYDQNRKEPLAPEAAVA